MLHMKQVSKRFTLHHQHGTELQVLNNVDMKVSSGECVVLDGPSGMGKSTLLKLVYANYRATSGLIEVCQTDGRVLELTRATPRELVRMRRDTVGYVSQFLRVIPRVSALDVVAESLDGSSVLVGEVKWTGEHSSPAAVAASLRAKMERVPFIKGRQVVTALWMRSGRAATGIEVITPDRVLDAL